MLNINQKYVILGQPFQMNWNILSRFQTCLMYLPLDRWFFFWKNWSLITTKGERVIETHDSYYLNKKKLVTIKIYKFRWYRIILTDHIVGKLDNDIVVSKFKEVEFPGLSFHFDKISEIKCTSFAPSTKLKEINFSNLNPSIKIGRIYLKSTNYYKH